VSLQLLCIHLCQAAFRSTSRQLSSFPQQREGVPHDAIAAAQIHYAPIANTDIAAPRRREGFDLTLSHIQTGTQALYHGETANICAPT
jgi:hypothetical protein